MPSAAQVRHPAAPACGAGQSCRVDKVDKELSWQTWHRQIRQRCLLTWTVIKYGVMQPLAKKLHQSSQECSLRQKCALICLSGLFPLHSNNCYAWICSISDNQASANLECCWTIQVFSSLLTGSCLLKAYHSYLRLKGSHPRKLVKLARKLVKLASFIWAPALVNDSYISFLGWNALLNHEWDENICLSLSFDVIYTIVYGKHPIALL